MRGIAAALLLLLASHADAAEQKFPRATAPHMGTLQAALASLFTLPFYLNYDGDGVVITTASFAGVNLSSVQTAVAAAPADTTSVAAKFNKATVVGLTPCTLRAIAEVLLDEVNVIRANIAAASLTPRTLTQMNTAIDNKIDALGCQ